jgi:hypothetical protein
MGLTMMVVKGLMGVNVYWFKLCLMVMVVVNGEWLTMSMMVRR